jgi:hypothetical protein
MVLFEFIGVLGLGIIIGLYLSNTFINRQEQRQLDEAFYQLINRQHGKISLIQLAALARVESKKAQSYLEEQAVIFAAMPDLDQEGNSFYQFPKLPNLPSLNQSQW